MSEEPEPTVEEIVEVGRFTRVARRVDEWRTPVITLLGTLLSIVIAFVLWEVVLSTGPDAYYHPWIYPVAATMAVVFGFVGVVSSLLWAAGKAFSREEKRAFRGAGDRSAIWVTGDNSNVTVNSESDDGEPSDNPPRLIGPDAQEVMLRRIYSHGIAQARVSFFVSIIFAAIGSSVLLYGVWRAVANATSNGEKYAAIVTQTSGVVIDILAGVFFLQSNRARKDMGNQGVMLREDSRSDRRLNAAGILVDGISDAQIQNDIRARMALMLVDGDPVASRRPGSSDVDRESSETNVDGDRPSTDKTA